MYEITEQEHRDRMYWSNMSFAPNLMTKVAKWTGETWMAAHPDHDGNVFGSWTEYRPSTLITTCCYGNCEKWAHGNTATHRWFAPRYTIDEIKGGALEWGLPFVALCKGHAKERRAEGEDVVAYTTLCRLHYEAVSKESDAEKADRANHWDRGWRSRAFMDRSEARLTLWWTRQIIRWGRSYGLDGCI